MDWTDKERAAIAELMRDQELSESALLRQCLRYYQADHVKRRNGETVVWSGDEQRARDFAGTTPAPSPTPQGGEWVMVPREATPEMVEAMRVRSTTNFYDWADIYAAMVGAAPAPSLDTGNLIDDPLYTALDSLYNRGWSDLHQKRKNDPRGTNEWQAVLDLFRAAPTPPKDAREVTWTDTQCLRFLATGFRHVRIVGEITCDEIRQGVAAALSPGNDSAGGAT